MNTISIDVGGTMVKHALLDEQGTILTKSAFPTPEDKEEFLEGIVEVADRYEEAGTVQAITFSFPGYINPHTGYAETSGAILYFYHQNIKEQLEEALSHRYPVYIENDANCAALAEKVSGNAQGVDNFLVLTVGTGIGGAFYVNGELYRGFQFKAGEFGRMRINHALAPEKDLHQFSSVRALINQYKSAKGLDTLDLVTGEQILDEMADDSDVRVMVESWIDTLCVGLFNVVTVLNPEKILIGGGISSHPAFLPLVRERLHRLWDWPEFKAPIVPCKYLNDAGLIGAYYHAMEQKDNFVNEK
ncbi:ROK family protein [Atopococcus tabaci]|uniref:ROK family protein n=1 Tax=Atopococcus tabaci TaxID=269774 RepID=UPI000429E3A0|nr:ROK family protein [Atopococcus tabaci]